MSDTLDAGQGTAMLCLHDCSTQGLGDKRANVETFE